MREFVQNSADMNRIDIETCLRRVCVMNIPLDISEPQLASTMARCFGPVEKSYMRYSRNPQKSKQSRMRFLNRPPTKYGFVTFHHKASRDKAIEKQFVQDHEGRKWQIKTFRSRNEARNQQMRDMEQQHSSKQNSNMGPT